MNQTPAEPVSKFPCTAGEWNTLRASLQGSVMARTSLAKLAKSMGAKWPVKGRDETPGRYLAHTLEELADMPEFYGKGNRLALLHEILLETRRMDDPFAEMTRHLDDLAQEDCPAPSFLQQLDVPAEFPVDLVNFSERTLSLCRDGGHATLAQLIAFLQQSASAVIMNDEFRQFLNALDERDTTRLGQYLPIRDGSRGIFLAEALGHVGWRLSAAQAATLVYAYKITTTNADWGEDAVLPRGEALTLIARVKGTAAKCFGFMPAQAGQLRSAVASGLNSSVRFFVSLNDPDLECLALAITMAALDAKPRFRGFMGIRPFI